MRTVLPRPDLDGLRLRAADSPDIWLVFRGERHRIASLGVYAGLFRDPDEVADYGGLASITLGSELGEGTCLIRGEGSLSIYLLARSDTGAVQKHFIPTYETLLDFDFDETKVRSVPALVIDGLEEGVELTSAADRAGRR